MKNLKVKYWIIVASKDHVKAGMDAGIAQASHGKSSHLKRIKMNDFIIYYSGKQTMGKVDKCQEFTAIGKVKDNEIYQVKITEDFSPYRRNIEFYKSEDVSILPLINDLMFIQNKKSWGAPFRFGMLEILKTDFDLISSKMLHKTHA